MISELNCSKREENFAPLVNYFVPKKYALYVKLR